MLRRLASGERSNTDFFIHRMCRYPKQKTVKKGQKRGVKPVNGNSIIVKPNLSHFSVDNYV